MTEQQQFTYTPAPQQWTPAEPAQWAAPAANWQQEQIGHVPTPPRKPRRAAKAAAAALLVAAIGVGGYVLPHPAAAAPAATSEQDTARQLAACQDTVKGYTTLLMGWSTIGTNYIAAMKALVRDDYSEATDTIDRNTRLIDKQTADFTAQNDERNLCLGTGH